MCDDFIITTTRTTTTLTAKSSDNKIENHETCWLAGFACLTRSICQKWSDNNNNNSNTHTVSQSARRTHTHTYIYTIYANICTHVFTYACEYVEYLCIYIMYVVFVAFWCVCFFENNLIRERATAHQGVVGGAAHTPIVFCPRVARKV